MGTVVLLGAQQALKFISTTPELTPIVSSVQLILEGLVLIVILRFWPLGLVPEKSPRAPKLKRGKADEAQLVKEEA